MVANHEGRYSPKGKAALAALILSRVETRRRPFRLSGEPTADDGPAGHRTGKSVRPTFDRQATGRSRGPAEAIGLSKFS